LHSFKADLLQQRVSGRLVAIATRRAAPAFAAKGFWIVRGPDKKCVVVETEPTATETTVTRVGKNIYVTREEAEADLAVVCK
jgi:hypothetical protein